ncbi:tyrosine-type recombinase/integrase [Terrarubrum flagellatum]|uniref:tyrosine-type recombinase/integrase n=1 Tax=Terrirubrum flagellatum TaxID=2895980 RepID=UPI00314556F2
MPRDLPKYVEKNRVKGHVYLSFRRGKGARIPLPGKPGSPEFDEAYAAALSGVAAAKKQARPGLTEGTIAFAIASYMRSPAYTDLRKTSKAGYATRINILRDNHGHRTLSGLNQERIEQKILAPYHDRPGQRLALLKMLRIIIRHCIGKGWLKADPSQTIKRPKTKEIRAWTDAEIAAFEQRWPIGTQQRLAFALHLFTGQRRSDVHRMTWADIAGSTIAVAQQKTGHKLRIALHEDLRAVLAATPRKHAVILPTVYGAGRTVNGFSQWMRDAITDAGLPLDAKPHGLRKAAGRRLADVGCSAHEIMSVLGLKTLAEAERYTREADQRRLSVSAIEKLQGQKANRTTQTAPDKFGEIANKKGKS